MHLSLFEIAGTGTQLDPVSTGRFREKSWTLGVPERPVSEMPGALLLGGYLTRREPFRDLRGAFLPCPRSFLPTPVGSAGERPMITRESSTQLFSGALSVHSV